MTLSVSLKTQRSLFIWYYRIGLHSNTTLKRLNVLWKSHRSLLYINASHGGQKSKVLIPFVHLKLMWRFSSLNVIGGGGSWTCFRMRCSEEMETKTGYFYMINFNCSKQINAFFPLSLTLETNNSLNVHRDMWVWFKTYIY